MSQLTDRDINALVRNMLKIGMTADNIAHSFHKQKLGISRERVKLAIRAARKKPQQVAAPAMPTDPAKERMDKFHAKHGFFQTIETYRDRYNAKNHI